MRALFWLLLGLAPALFAAPERPGCKPSYHLVSGRGERELAPADRPSLRDTAGVPPEKRKLVEGDEFFRWRLADYRSRVGQTIDFYFELGDKDAFVPQQEILTRDQLSPRELALVQSLARLQSKPKFVRRSFEDAFHQSLAEAEKYITLDNTGALVEPRTTAQQDAKAYSEPGVEVGAWRITLADGTVHTALHTSADPHKVRQEDYMAAIDGLASRIPQLGDSPPVLVQYFHTHPSGSPLSEPDLLGAKRMKSHLAAQGLQIPFHIYSVGRVEGEPILFHFGLR